MSYRRLTCIEVTCDDCGAGIDEFYSHHETVDAAASAARDAEWYVSPDLRHWICWECLDKPEHGHLRALRDAMLRDMGGGAR